MEPVNLGRVPVRVHGVGVYYRRFFDVGAAYFRRICAEHAFQSLTESTKPGIIDTLRSSRRPGPT